MYSPLTIGLDFDESLFDINKGWLDALERATGHKTEWHLIRNWDFSPAIPRELLPTLWEVRTPAIYQDATPAVGARAAVNNLAAKGHRLVCITSDTGAFARVKCELLRRHFPAVRHLIIAKDKWAQGIDLLLDDYPGAVPSILLNKPWNEAVPLEGCQLRAYHWGEVPSLVREFGGL
jgi:5'(3')-deoxyribonucleotidase